MTRIKTPPYLFTVLTGPNGGAQLRLNAGKVRLGAGEDTDIGIDDPKVAPLELAFVRNRVRIAPVAAGMRLGDGRALRAGRSAILDLPLTLSLSDATQIHVCEVARPAKRGWVWQVAPVAAVVAVIGGVAMASLTDAFDPRAATMAQSARVAPPAMSSTAATQAAEVPISTPAPAQMTAEDAVAMLREMAAAEGLSGLTIAVEDGAIRVSGRQSPDQAAAWTRMHQAFDEQNGGRFPLLLDVSEEEVGAPMAVASVWLGERPELTTRDGRVMGLGDATPDGWKVVAINAGEVTLSRGDQSLILEF